MALQPSGPTVSSPAHFKLVLFIVVGVIAVAFVAMCVLALTGATNTASKDLFAVCEDAFKVGFAALLGLIGGKAL
jgi:hypothetical protein